MALSEVSFRLFKLKLNGTNKCISSLIEEDKDVASIGI